MTFAFRYWLENMGDHTVAGWVCAGAHVVAATCSLRAAVRSMARTPERLLWASVGLLLLIVGLNKQLDLQILAIGELRALFGHRPWWNSRRLIAQALVAAFALAAVGGLLAFDRRAFSLLSRNAALAAGAAVVLAAVVLARGTAGFVNDALVFDLYGVEGDFLQVQVKDMLEFVTASVVVVCCMSRSRWAVPARVS